MVAFFVLKNMAVKLQPDFSTSPTAASSAQLKPAPKPAPKPQSSGGGGGGGGGGSWGGTPTSKTTTTSSGGSSGGGYAVGGWYNGRQWDGSRFGAPGEIIVGGGGNSGGGDSGGGDNGWDSQLDAIYNGYLSSLDQMASNANTTFGEQEKQLNDQVNTQSTQLDTQKGQLLDDTQTSENRYNDTLRSAYEDAVRSYNALAQQARARFGRGSSAGGAVGELAQQEFFRQQGQLQQKGVQGAEDFGKERIKINTYITDQLNQLTLYKNQAMDQLRQSLRDQLASIDAKKTEVQSNKARDKMALLQQAVSTAQSIADQERTQQRNIALQALGQMQQITGKTFTPAEIVAYLQDFQNQFVAAGGIGSSQNAYASGGTYRYTGNPKDELQGVVNPYGNG